LCDLAMIAAKEVLGIGLGFSGSALVLKPLYSTDFVRSGSSL